MECLFNNFLKTLPLERKIGENTERYIDTEFDRVENFELLVNMAKENNKYFYYNDIPDYGYSVEKFKRMCDINNINMLNCCCSIEEKYILGEIVYSYEYDPYKCSVYFASEVHDWLEICGYHLLFLLGKVPGTPHHPGPWNGETELILEPLSRILRNGILTFDSQPGMVVKDDNGIFAQKPYLMIAGPIDRLYRIVKTLLTDDTSFESRMIKYVSYELSVVNFDEYISFNEEGQNYYKIMLGVKTPAILTEEYNHYILSNQFFNRIADVVENTL